MSVCVCICFLEKEGNKKRDDSYIDRYSRLMQSSFLNIRNEFEKVHFVSNGEENSELLRFHSC